MAGPRTHVHRTLPRRAGRNSGFTLAELLVCMGILGLLAALALPAVQSSRESARKLQCTNNLRQIGMGLHAFESARQTFPYGGDMTLDGSAGQVPRAHAPHLQLLPYLDQGPLHSTIDPRLAAERWLTYVPGANDANEPAKRATIPIFLCPSDGGGFPERRNNYRAGVGVTAFPRDPNVPQNPPLPGAGPFYPVNRAPRVQGFIDGLSNTVGFSEKLGGAADGKHFSPAREYFFLDVPVVNSIWNSPNCEALHVEACASLTDTEVRHESRTGEFWFYAGFSDTWYNHLLTPNHPIPDCGFVSGMLGSGVMTARSLHPGGVNCLMMDGAVRFVANSIDRGVWQAVGTRNGRDPAQLD